MGPTDTDDPMTYEAIRKQRLEENKKRMEELGLANLSKSLKGSMHHKASGKSRLPKSDASLIEVRRSSRVADGPQPDYREVILNFPVFGRSSTSSRLPKRYASDKARLQAAKMAEKIKEELPADNPSFVKLMLQSHTSGCFWMGLPLKFCRKHLPKNDGTIFLQDEGGGEWECVYIAARTGLSGGWRGFAIDHHLGDGDAVVFEVIQPRKMKVHIVRSPEDDATKGQKQGTKGAKKAKKEGKYNDSGKKTPNKEKGCGTAAKAEA